MRFYVRVFTARPNQSENCIHAFSYSFFFFFFFLSFFGPIRKYICKKSRESVNVHTAENIFKNFKTVCCIKYLNNSSLYTLFLNVLFFLCSSLFLFFSIQRRVFIYFFRRHVAREKKTI